MVVASPPITSVKVSVVVEGGDQPLQECIDSFSSKKQSRYIRHDHAGSPSIKVYIYSLLNVCLMDTWEHTRKVPHHATSSDAFQCIETCG